MALPLIMHLDGLCRTAELSGTLPPSDQLISIDLPVGQGVKARNLDRDVRTIQGSLNKIKPIHGGPTQALAIDGICGPKTNKAIGDFQFKQFGLPGKDGVIEPGKQTINRINQLLFSNLPVDPSVNAEIRAKVVSHLNLVRISIHAAQANLLSALGPSGLLGSAKETADRRLNSHFALNTVSANRRDQVIRDILSVFNVYASALLMPGALGAGAFEADPTGDPRIAFTFGNRFFLQGQVEPQKNIPLDRIFLGRRAFFAINDGEFCAFIMLHEMAHFVGFRGGSFIGDNGRGWFTDSTIQKLNADQRLHNADSYATFCVECRTGNPAKPPYVKAANSSR